MFDRNKDSLWNITERHAYERFGQAIKTNDIGYGMYWKSCGGNGPIYYKAKGIHKKILAVAGVIVIVVHTAIVMQKVEIKLMQLS